MRTMESGLVCPGGLDGRDVKGVFSGEWRAHSKACISDDIDMWIFQ
jgi:hypothetical protein